MIPDLQASLLCDDVRQEKNGKFIVVGIFDGLAVAKFPSVFHKICIVNRWCCGHGQFMQSTRVIAPDGQTPVVTGKDVPIKLMSDRQAATSVEVFINLKIEQAGTYWVEISLDGQLRMRYPLAIQRVPVPESKA